MHRQFEFGPDAGIGLAGVRPSHRVRSILHRPVRREEEGFADGGYARGTPRPGLVGGELHLAAQFGELGHVGFDGFK